VRGRGVLYSFRFCCARARASLTGFVVGAFAADFGEEVRVTMAEVTPVAPGPGEIARVLAGQYQGLRVRVLRVVGDLAAVQNVWSRVKFNIPMASIGRIADQSDQGRSPDTVLHVRSAVVFTPAAPDADAPSSSLCVFGSASGTTTLHSIVALPPGRAQSACIMRNGNVLVVVRGAAGSRLATVSFNAAGGADVLGVLEVPDAATRCKSVDLTRAVVLCGDTHRALLLRQDAGSLSIVAAVPIAPGAVDIDVLGDQLFALFADGRVEASSIGAPLPESRPEHATALVQVRACAGGRARGHAHWRRVGLTHVAHECPGSCPARVSAPGATDSRLAGSR
jgi:hypothetical protein